MRNQIAEDGGICVVTWKTCVCFAARVSGFVANIGISKPYRKKRETCCDPVEGKSVHICLFALRKAVPVLKRRFDP